MTPESTVADYFQITEDSVDESKWEILKQKLETQIKNIHWTKAVPDLAKKIGELLNIKIPDILVKAWTKADSIRKAMEETKNNDKSIYIELAEHKINSEHHPYMEIRIGGVVQPQKIQFHLKLIMDLKGFILKISDGLIQEIQTGSVEMSGTFKYESLKIFEKKCEPIKLPVVIKMV